ncbi:hypothetical protein N9E48_00840 [Paracoccaceae bacterium]|nr:hypothetical protein [Paracoccaceae bacterium]
MITLKKQAPSSKSILKTGSHLNSAKAVSQGNTNFAALDAYT